MRIWHRRRPKLRPVPWSFQSSGLQKALVERSRRKGSHQAEHRETRWPGIHHFSRAFRHPGRIAIHPEYEGRDRIDPSACQTDQRSLVIGGLIEALLYATEIVSIHRLQSNKDASRAARCHQILKLLVLKKVHADLSNPGHNRILDNHVAQ